MLPGEHVAAELVGAARGIVLGKKSGLDSIRLKCEELGLDDAPIAREARVDPGGRDGCRAPIPWTTGDGHGWAGTPWLPWPPEAAGRSAAVQRDDSTSILHLYRRLIAARRASPALHAGSWFRLDAPSSVLAYERALDDDVRRVAAGFGDDDRLVHATQAEATRRCAVPRELAEGTLHERDLDGLLRFVLRHVGQPVISATVLPRLAAMRSGAGMLVSAFIVARTTLIGLREP